MTAVKLLLFSMMYVSWWYCINVVIFYREETEIIEGEVVEIQIDRPATGTVSLNIIIALTYVVCNAGEGFTRLRMLPAHIIYM